MRCRGNDFATVACSVALLPPIAACSSVPSACRGVPLAPSAALEAAAGAQLFSGAATTDGCNQCAPLHVTSLAPPSTSFDADREARLTPRWRALVAGILVGALLWLRSPGAAQAKPKSVIAMDKGFKEVVLSSWARTSKGLPDLVQGLRGDPFWLLPGKEGGTIRNYALKAECTHLGCIAPWDARSQKFVCPCHGSEYDAEGVVLRGPAPHSLALAHVELVQQEKVQLSAWTEEDFRDGEVPWWT